MRFAVITVLAIFGPLLVAKPGFGQSKKKAEPQALYAVPSPFLTPNFSWTHPNIASTKGEYCIVAEGRTSYFGSKGLYFHIDDEFRLLFLDANKKVKIEPRDRSNTVVFSDDSTKLGFTYNALALINLWPGVN